MILVPVLHCKGNGLVHLNQRNRKAVIRDQSVIHVYDVIALGAEIVEQLRSFAGCKGVSHVLAPREEAAAVEVEQRRAICGQVRIGVDDIQKAVRILCPIGQLADQILPVFFFRPHGWIGRLIGVQRLAVCAHALEQANNHLRVCSRIEITARSQQDHTCQRDSEYPQRLVLFSLYNLFHVLFSSFAISSSAALASVA